MQREVNSMNATFIHHHIVLTVENVDTLRGGQLHNLLDAERRASYLRKISEGKFDITIVAPPCNKHSRAVFANTDGPRPIRDFWNPRGMPTLTAEERILADESNTLLDFAVQAVQAAAKASEAATSWRIPRAVMEFPEDLGEAKLGIPASAWQLDSLKLTGDMGMTRGAIFQCEWDEIDYQKPTGLLTSIPELIEHEGFLQGLADIY